MAASRRTGLGPPSGWLMAMSAALAAAVLGLGGARADSGPQVVPNPTVPVRDVVCLPATADVWLADTTVRERNASSGKAVQVKLKNVQELAIFRFDAGAILGREVRKASLYLHRCGRDKLRYLRVSTVNQDWREGEGQRPYGPPDGATFLMADAGRDAPRTWAWPGSSVADVIMTSGHSLDCWAERKEVDRAWIAVEVLPELIYALAVGDTDGLAVMDGGNPADENNFISSGQSAEGRPFLEVELGGPLVQVPAEPRLAPEPAPDRAGRSGGAIRLRIDPAPDVFCWRVRLDGLSVPRWQVKHPAAQGPTAFVIEDVEPGVEHEVEVVAVSRGGQASPPARAVVAASPAQGRHLALGPWERPSSVPAEVREAGGLRVWAAPGLVKIAPVSGEVLADDLGAPRGSSRAHEAASAVWDGRQIRLFGARGEYVSCQLCLENLERAPVKAIRIRPQALAGPGGASIGPESVELFLNHGARNRRGQWQPAYCAPLAHGAPLAIPQSESRLRDQRNQTVYVDLYIPKDARPGEYRGAISVALAADTEIIDVPVALEVLDFVLPDRLTFWPELNAFRVPPDALDYYRLAHQHRCVLNCWAWRPRLAGSGRNVRLDWALYDRHAGPLLTGAAFAGNRRAGVPVECMYLPFEDSWPTPLSPETYRYRGAWPRAGDPLSAVIEHYLTAEPIERALSEEYREAFLAVQRLFIEHFQEKGYAQTEMQCCFGGKATHRIDFGTNVWWTTDEPYYWSDWLALRYFLGLWASGRGPADPRNWVARADISRPQWQGRVLEGVLDVGYYGAGGFTGAAQMRRARTLAEEQAVRLRTYGAASPDDASNLQTVAALLSAWAHGADAFSCWQSLGSEEALDRNDTGAEAGSALLVPGDRFGIKVVGDMRLKALRDAQQLIEYLSLLAERQHLTRDQVRAMLGEALASQGVRTGGSESGGDDALELTGLTAWDLYQLRRRVADLLAR